MKYSQRLKLQNDSPRNYIIISAIKMFHLKQFLFIEEYMAERHLHASMKRMHSTSDLNYCRSCYLKLFKSEQRGMF